MKKTVLKLDNAQFMSAAAILRSIAHPARLAILQLLERYERLSVNEICDLLETEQSLTSHHLSHMRNHEILGYEREGQRIFYFLKMQEATKILRCIEDCMGKLEMSEVESHQLAALQD